MLQNQSENAKVDVRSVTISYDLGAHGTSAVENVSFQVLPGELFVILGPSGCGKSTLLKSIASLIPIRSGEILFDGKPITGPDPQRILVFQEFDQLLPWKTVGQNIGFVLRVTQRQKSVDIPSTITKYLRLVGLSDSKDAYPHTLSGGMKQRVAIARALALDPQVLLMDEPFGSLDAQTRTTLQGELLNIWRQTNKTIIFVTHSVAEAVALGTRILVFSSHPGRVKELIDNRATSTAGGFDEKSIELQVHITKLLEFTREGKA